MSAATAIQHQPWCRDHYTEDDHPEQPGWCHHAVLEVGAPRHQRMGVSIQPRMHDAADSGIDVYTDDDKLSPDEARRLASALLRAADVLDGQVHPSPRIVRVCDLGREGVWLTDYGILLVDASLTTDEAKGLLADAVASEADR